MMDFYFPEGTKCSNCGDVIIIEAGHPFYSGTAQEQYCMKCVKKLRAEGLLG